MIEQSDKPTGSTATFQRGRVGIVGAGIAGLVAGFMLRRAGWHVTIFERGHDGAAAGASAVAAGMLAPWAELATAEPDIAARGIEGLALWRDIANAIDDPDALSFVGSLIVAHPRDHGELDRLARRIARAGHAEGVVPVDETGLATLEPGLSGRFRHCLSLPGEGHADPARLLPSLRRWLHDHGAVILGGTVAEPSRDGTMTMEHRTVEFDLAVDCRGMGARGALPDLRGVRGEVLVLRSAEVRLQRPVRVLHPRWPIYVVPRGDGRFVVGATEIESDDAGPVSARSALELLSAAYALDPAFGEATIEELRTGVRPAFADNRPRLAIDGRLIRFNGLYRHGYLLAPALARRLTILAERTAGTGATFETGEIFA